MTKLQNSLGAAAHCCEILKAVAHPLRLRIIALLCDGKRSVSEMAEQLDAPPVIVSQQLRILRNRGLIGFERKGGFALYRLLEPGLKGLIKCIEKCGRKTRS